MTDISPTAGHPKPEDWFAEAFQLAYFLHVDKDIAFFVAEDALDELPVMLGKAKYRKPMGRLRGMWKSGERIRAIRRTITLDKAEMLQWLVYRHSERWELETEA